MSHSDGPVTVLYDADCGFCRWSVAGLLRWDRHHRLRPLALQDPEADRLLAGMSHERRMGSAHAVTPDGRVHSAGAAAEPVAAVLPAGAPVAWLAGRLPGLTGGIYRLVAGQRGFLGSRLSAAARSGAAERIAARHRE